MASHKASFTQEGAHPAEAVPEVDIGFGSLFKGLGDFVGVLGKLVEAGEQQVDRTGEFKVKGLGDKAHGVYGVSVRVGIGGEPHVERFGNIRSTQRRSRGRRCARAADRCLRRRRPKSSSLPSFPGVKEDAIEIEVRGDVLALSSSGERRYAKEVLLPNPVDSASMRRSFKNGLLELRLKKS